MEVVVLDVVRPGPGYFDRRPEHLRQQRRLRDIIGLRFPAEATAEQGDVHGHVALVQAEHFRHRRSCGLWVLGWGPNLAAIVDDTG